jgi:hypothetical protein
VVGSFGTQNNPIRINVSGTANLSGSSTQDNVSAYVNGSGNFNFTGSLDGFVYVNGKVADQIGQKDFRTRLNYSLFNANVPSYIPIPALLPAAPVMMPMGAGIAMVPALPISVPAVTVSTIAPLSQPIDRLPKDIKRQPAGPLAVQKPAISMQPAIDKPKAVTEAGARIPQLDNKPLPLQNKLLLGIIPVSPQEIKMIFPGGHKVSATYDFGVPLGTEKPLMDPGIQEDDSG